MTRALRTTAVAVACASVVSLVAALMLEAVDSETLTALIWPVPYIAVGLLLTLRRPTLLTGWLFTMIGFLVTSGAAAEELTYRGLTGPGTPAPGWAVFTAWYGEWYWVLLIYFTVILLPLLFPEGVAVSALWRRLTRIIVGAMIIFTVTAALQDRLDTAGEGANLWVPNPIGVPGLIDIEEGILSLFLVVITGAFIVTAFTGLVVRFRRSAGVERQQLKLFTAAGVMLIAGFVAQGVLDAFYVRVGLIDVTLFALTPLAAAVAIMRYRLYAIDRLISRTVTYALVTAVLVAVYIGAITIMSAALGTLGGESPLVVATATLAAAALFRPARTRIQNVVDRRFNRARYDTERTVEGFRERVRHDVDLERLETDLVSVARETLQPTAAMLWMLPTEQSS